MIKFQMYFENKGEIYIITSPSGKQYIGQTIRGTEVRWKQHICAAKNIDKGCVKLNNCINKYKPENFLVETLLVCDVRYLNYFESYMIKEYNTLSPNGLNLKTGGVATIYSDESKKKMSNSAKGKTFSEATKEKIRIGNLGKVVSEETRVKLSSAIQGKKLSEEHKEKISKFQKDYLQPKRKYFGLPDYIYLIAEKKKQGYMVRNHPSVPNRYFVSAKRSMEEKLKQTEEYLQQVQGSTTK